MNQLVYSQRLVAQPSLAQFLKDAFRATPLGMFIAALREQN